jgi:hypothetical protein
MKKLAMVLAVPHQLQGLGFRGYVEDPSYPKLLKQFVREDVDFVFEEATGRGPTIAEGLTESLLGAGHYMDVDPPPTERKTLGIATAGGGEWIEPGYTTDYYEWAITEEKQEAGRVVETKNGGSISRKRSHDLWNWPLPQLCVPPVVGWNPCRKIIQLHPVCQSRQICSANLDFLG